jgi:amino acid efflux transporter
VLGHGAGTPAPLAALLRRAVGPAGTAAAAVAAVVLTLGAVNAYVNGAAAMTGHLMRPRGTGPGEAVGPGDAAARPGPRFLAVIAGSGLTLITLYGLGLASPAALVVIPTALFLAVYLGCMASAVRVLRGPARLAAAPAAVVVVVVLGYCGWALAAPLLVAVMITIWSKLFSRSAMC